MNSDERTPHSRTLAPQQVLGAMVSFTISENGVDLDRLHDLVAEYSLTPSIAKAKIRRVDGFKKAVHALETRLPEVEGLKSTFKVKTIHSDQNAIECRLVAERRHKLRLGRKPEISYLPLCRISYDRGQRNRRDRTVTNDSIFTEMLVPPSQLFPDEAAWLDQTLGVDGVKLAEAFEHYCTHLDVANVRAFVRDYLDHLDAVAMKHGASGGGLYFVPQSSLPELRRLAKLVRDIGSHMHPFPLVDDADQRAELHYGCTEDLAEQVRAVIAESRKITTSQTRTIGQATYDTFVTRKECLVTKTQRYESLLNVPLDDVQKELTELSRLIDMLQPRVVRRALSREK